MHDTFFSFVFLFFCLSFGRLVLSSEEAGGETKRLMESHAFLFLFGRLTIKGPAKDKEKERERHREGLVVNSSRDYERK